MKIRQIFIRTLVSATYCFSLSSPAYSAPVLWELQDVVTRSGTIVTGHFTYDAVVDSYSQVDIVSHFSAGEERFSVARVDSASQHSMFGFETGMEPTIGNGYSSYFRFEFAAGLDNSKMQVQLSTESYSEHFDLRLPAYFRESMPIGYCVRFIDCFFGVAPDSFVSGTVVNKTSSCSASIGSRYWHDENANGVRENEESGVADVFVELVDINGEFVAKRRTGKDGWYKFEDLCEGVYQVRVATIPFGYRVTHQNEGSNERRDSDVDPVTGFTSNIRVHGTQRRRGVDVGIFEASSPF